MPEPKTPKAAKLPKTFTPRFIDDVDGRYAAAKELRSRYLALKADTGSESTQRDLLCRRAVFLSVLLETQECEAVETGKLDMGGYVQAVNSLQGLLKTLGLDKKVQQATDLRTYLSEVEAAS